MPGEGRTTHTINLRTIVPLVGKLTSGFLEANPFAAGTGAAVAPAGRSEVPSAFARDPRPAPEHSGVIAWTFLRPGLGRRGEESNAARKR
jgi:hypothetical protein